MTTPSVKFGLLLAFRYNRMVMPANEPQKWTLIVVEHVTEPMLTEFADMMANTPLVEVVTCSRLETVPLHFRDEGRYVLLIPTPSLNEVTMVRDFLLKLKGPIGEGWIIPVALNRIIAQESLRAHLKEMGFADVISSGSIRSSGLKKRIMSLIAIMNRRVKEGRQSIEHPEWRSLLKSAELPRFLEPLDLMADCWLFRGGDDVKRVNDTWIVNLMGPGPPAGSWERTHFSEGGEVDLWEWRTRSGGEFNSTEGSWIFRGRRPLFSDFHWVFVSKHPRLSFFQNESKNALDYFSIGADGKFEIRSNSDHAKRKWIPIRNSLLQEYRIPPDKIALDQPPFFAIIAGEKRADLGAKMKEHETPVPWRALLGLPPESDLGNPLFSRVETVEKRREYAAELHKRHPFATMWTKRQGFKINTRVVSFDLQSETLAMDLLGKPPLGDLKEDVMVNIRSQRGSLFFVLHPQDIQMDEKKTMRYLHFRLPQNLFEVQRRSHGRLEVPEDKVVFATLDGEVRPVVNLSAGGMAVLGDSFEMDQFYKGLIIENLRFNIGRVEIHCQAEVRWAKKRAGASAGADLVVGVQFRNLQSKDEQRISLFVLEEGFDIQQKA